MIYEYFDKALKVIKDNKIFYNEKILEKTIKYLELYMVNNDLINFLSKYSFTTFIEFNKVSFDKVNNLPDFNSEPENKNCIENGYLIIGSGLNGDLIVTNIKNMNVGFVFHDELWENPKVDFNRILIDMKCKIDEFYYNSIFKENYPVDAYQAEEYF